MFLAVWKEKWFSRMQAAKLAIEKSENRNVKQVIAKFANKYGVPFDFAITVAMIESGLNPNAHNSRYKGLFAMDPNDSYGGLSYKMGNRWNEPGVNADAGLRLISNQIKTFKKQVGTEAYATLKMGSWVNNIA
jgi:soluble lytic murein transglycosylase-like protein